MLRTNLGNFQLFLENANLTSISFQNLMEKRIRPWINKKIIEYIGEPEPTLVDFICSKVLAGSDPQMILDDVQMVCIATAYCKKWRQFDFNDRYLLLYAGFRRRS